MLFSRGTESHLRRDPGILPATTVADTLPMFLEELSQPRLCHAQMRCPQALPNLFALSKNPGVISPRFVPDQVVLASTVPDLLPPRVPVERISSLCICAGSFTENFSSLCICVYPVCVALSCVVFHFEYRRRHP